MSNSKNSTDFLELECARKSPKDPIQHNKNSIYEENSSEI
jgi:hypothetical protein